MRTDYNSPVRIAFRYIGYLSLVLLVGTLVYTMNYTFISKNDRQRLHDENGKLSREVQTTLPRFIVSTAIQLLTLAAVVALVVVTLAVLQKQQVIEAHNRDIDVHNQVIEITLNRQIDLLKRQVRANSEAIKTSGLAEPGGLVEPGKPGEAERP
jgi:hypothetical protein